MFKTNVPPTEEDHIKVSSVSKCIHHEKATLEARKVMKFHYHDLTSCNDEFPSHAQSIKLISTTSTTPPVNNDTLELYSEGETMSKFIYEERPTTMKHTFVAHPSLASHSTFYKCSRGILCQPQDPPHSPLTRLGVIISYSLRLERKITLPDPEIFSPYVYSKPSDKQYGAYTASQRRKQHQHSLTSRSTRVLNFKSTS